MTKKKPNRSIKFIKNYLPDIIIIIGIWIFSYGILRPNEFSIIQTKTLRSMLLFANWELKILAIILITIGLDIAIRRLVAYKKRNWNLDADELYDNAKEIVLKNNQVSASFLQRELRVGYARAAGLIDMLEEDKIVGPMNEFNSREVLKK